MTELHDAVRDNNLQEVKRLLEEKVDVNAITYAGNTPLKIAAWNRQTNIVKLLKQAGGKI